MQPRFKILMVDDIERYHSLYETAITDAISAHVQFANDGVKGLEILQKNGPFDLLVLDLLMPRMGGEEVLKQVRASPDYENMPIVILTGQTDGAKQSQLLDLGADDFIEKGAPPELFVARIKSQLRYRMTLEKLSRLAVDMDIFAAGVLHDIRNLETNIMSVCMLMEDYLQADVEANRPHMLYDLGLLIEKIEKLGRYAMEVMEVVKQTTTGLKLESQNIKDILMWAMDMSHSADRVGWEIVEPLGPVMADKHFLRLTMLNIINNTIKYRHPDHPIRIEISQKVAESRSQNPKGQQDSLGARIVTRVRDYGIGIPPQDLDKVFQPFVRGAHAKKDGGFGLGLSLVSKVVHTMGGRIWAEAPPSGPGVVMCIELPHAASDLSMVGDTEVRRAI